MSRDIGIVGVAGSERLGGDPAVVKYRLTVRIDDGQEHTTEHPGLFGVATAIRRVAERWRDDALAEIHVEREGA